MYDIAIVGAGVVGAMLARELSKYQLRVVLLEKENDVACGASKANSGIIHGGFDPEPGTLKATLNVQGIDLMYQACEELHVPHRRNGSMVLAFAPEEEPAIRALYERGKVNGIGDLQLLTGEEARALEPNLSEKVTLALLSPSAGIVCPYELTIAAVGSAMKNGVELRRNFTLSSVEKQENYILRSAEGETVEAAFVCNCAGGYSDRVARMVGDESFTVIPRAGEYMLLDKSPLVDHTIFQVPTKEGKGILVTPTVDGNILTGPTACRVDTPENTETTPAGLDIVKRLAAKSVPTVDFRQVITSFTGVRASEAGGDFIIAPSAAAERFVNVAAIDSPGLTSCVAIARYAVNVLRECGADLREKESWDGTREDPHAFRHMTPEEKNAFVREHPDYGRIICRCETVSKGEILHAIRTEPKPRDVDGVKRRTRAGMGRCQGGFCLPYVMKLLAEEQNIPLSAVTKNGGKSVYTYEEAGDRHGNA